MRSKKLLRSRRRFLPSISASSRNSSSCRLVRFRGVTSRRATIRSPAPAAADVRHALAGDANLVAALHAALRVVRDHLALQGRHLDRPPRAAWLNVIGTWQCRSCASRANSGCSRTRITQYRSPRRRPGSPASPSPVSRMLMSLSTPGGTFTVQRAGRPAPRRGPATGRARIGDDYAPAAAGAAGLLNAEETLALDDHAVAAAPPAGGRLGAAACCRCPALVADLLAREFAASS